MADVEAAKALYEESVRQIYLARGRLRSRFATAGDATKFAAVQSWVDCAEEMAAVSYDAVRFEQQAQAASKPETKAHCESEQARMLARHAELSAQLPALEAAIA